MWFSSKAQYAGKGGSPWQVLERCWGATWGRPLGELVSVHGGVTPLGKGNCHSLRGVPCPERRQAHCIRNYHFERVLGGIKALEREYEIGSNTRGDR